MLPVLLLKEWSLVTSVQIHPADCYRVSGWLLWDNGCFMHKAMKINLDKVTFVKSDDFLINSHFPAGAAMICTFCSNCQLNSLHFIRFLRHFFKLFNNECLRKKNILRTWRYQSSKWMDTIQDAWKLRENWFNLMHLLLLGIFKLPGTNKRESLGQMART